MKRSAVALALASLAFPAAGHAQVMFDPARVTCAYYVGMQPKDARLLSAFLSGWYKQKHGETKVDLNEYDQRVVDLRGWCGDHPKELVMNRLDQLSAAKQ